MTRQSLGPDIWGPWAWHLLHSVSINDQEKISPEEIDDYILFYKTIGRILPCVMCRYHYDMLTRNRPLYSSNLTRAKLIEWTWQLHNYVNEITNKDIKVSLKENIQLNKAVDNKQIFNFLNSLFNYINLEMSFEELLTYLTFLKTMSNIYPDRQVRNKLKQYIHELDIIGSPQQLKKWYFKYNSKWQS